MRDLAPTTGRSAAAGLLTTWAIASAIVFGLCAIWSLITPINAPDDQGAQVLRAVSVVRGEFLGSPVAATGPFSHTVSILYCEGFYRIEGRSAQAAASRCVQPYTVVTVPARFADWSFPQSCVLDYHVPDSCPTYLRGPDGPVQAVTYDGHYPPFYYAIVGLPSLVSQTDRGFYAMELLSGALTSALVGLAIALAAFWSKRRLVLGVAVAATPVVFVFGSTINPSGLEMSAALCAWTAALLLVIEHPARPPSSLIAGFAVSSVALALSRPISVLWLAVIVAFAVVLRPSSARTLLEDVRIRVAAGIVAVVSIAAAAYVFLAHSLAILPASLPPSRTASEWTILGHSLGQTFAFVDQAAGGFGFLYTNPPILGALMVALAVGAVLVVAIRTAHRRDLAVLGLLVVVAFLVPLIIEVSQARDAGYNWAGRYSYPLYCGIIVMAAAVSDVRRIQSLRRYVVAVACLVGGSQLLDILWALRRYTVGLSGPLNLFDHVRGGFATPVPIVVLVIGAAGFCGAYVWLIIHVVMTGAVNDKRPHPAEAERGVGSVGGRGR